MKAPVSASINSLLYRHHHSHRRSTLIIHTDYIHIMASAATFTSVTSHAGSTNVPVTKSSTPTTYESFPSYKDYTKPSQAVRSLQEVLRSSVRLTASKKDENETHISGKRGLGSC